MSALPHFAAYSGYRHQVAAVCCGHVVRSLMFQNRGGCTWSGLLDL